MSITNPALNLSFAASESARLAYAERGADEAVASQLKFAVANSNALPVGSTITARYQYKVAEDGTLIPLQTQITTSASSEDKLSDANNGSRRRSTREQSDNRRPTFTDINRPRPNLSPTDELALFSDGSDSSHALSTLGTNDPATAQTVASATKQGEAIDDQGEVVNVEILAPDSDESEHILVSNGSTNLSVAARAQASVAGLYARNSNVALSVLPYAEFAA